MYKIHLICSNTTMEKSPESRVRRKKPTKLQTGLAAAGIGVVTLLSLSHAAGIKNQTSRAMLQAIGEDRDVIAKKLEDVFATTKRSPENGLPKIVSNDAAQKGLNICTSNLANCEAEPASDLYEVDSIIDVFRAEINCLDFRRRVNDLQICQQQLETCIDETVLQKKKETSSS